MVAAFSWNTTVHYCSQQPATEPYLKSPRTPHNEWWEAIPRTRRTWHFR